MTTPSAAVLDDILEANAIEARLRAAYPSDTEILDGLDIVHMRANNRVVAKIAAHHGITTAALIDLCNERAGETQVGGIAK